MRTQFATNLSRFLHQLIEKHAKELEQTLASNSLNLLDVASAPYASASASAAFFVPQHTRTYEYECVCDSSCRRLNYCICTYTVITVLRLNAAA